MLSQRHFEYLSRVLRSSSTRANVAHTSLCIEIADAFASDHPRFKRDKFLKACGVTIEHALELAHERERDIASAL